MTVHIIYVLGFKYPSKNPYSNRDPEILSIMNTTISISILTDCQHGFRSRRSCDSQLISTIQRIAEKLKKSVNNRKLGKDQIDVILRVLEFAKAFDKVPHKRLLHKPYEWITSFLSSKTQQVLVEGCESAKLDVLSGVAQAQC